MILPSHCSDCGFYLTGGATKHRKTCSFYAMSYQGMIESQPSLVIESVVIESVVVQNKTNSASRLRVAGYTTVADKKGKKEPFLIDTLLYEGRDLPETFYAEGHGHKYGEVVPDELAIKLHEALEDNQVIKDEWLRIMA